MTYFYRLLLWLTLALSMASQAYSEPTDLLSQQPEIKTFINDMVEKHQFDSIELNRVFNQVNLKPAILQTMDRPATAKSWYQYHPSFLNASRINAGVQFWKKQAKWLQQAKNQFGVPEELIIAIIGVETSYGKNKGSYRAIDVLSTLAFHYPRRADFFKDELAQFLRLTRDEKIDPFSLKSSYAGAMGWPQFMPSSFQRFAIDFDGDGHRDIWNSEADIIGSVANYLHAAGWQLNQPVATPANVSGDNYPELLKDKFTLRYTIKELSELGVTPQIAIPEQEKAILFPLETESETEYWLGLNNFYVITRYNRSTLYAMSVYLLSEEIRRQFLNSHVPAIKKAS